MVGYEFESGPTPEEEARKMAHRKKIRRRIYLGILTLFFMAVWLEPDLDDLHELCAALEPSVIYRTVQANGYFEGRGSKYCGHCWLLLGSSSFDFMEFAYTPPERSSPIAEPGMYRLRKEPVTSADCDQVLTKRYLRFNQENNKTPEGIWCLVLENIELREARYGEYLDNLGYSTVNPLTGTTIYKRRHFYVDHETDEVIAESHDYIFDKLPWLQGDLGPNTKDCNFFQAELGRRGLYRELVIKSTGRWTYERQNRGGVPGGTAG